MKTVTTTGTRAVGRPPEKGLDSAILDATIDALSETGFESLSIADVARRASTTTPAIYRRFKDKAELVTGAMEREIDNIAIRMTDNGSLRADLLVWMRGMVKELTPKRTRLLAGLVLASTKHEIPANILANRIRQLGTRERETIIEAATRRGELVGNTLPEIVWQLPSALIVHLVLTLQPLPDGKAIEQFVDHAILPALLAVDGLAPPHESITSIPASITRKRPQ